jgi:hypothetical protein
MKFYTINFTTKFIVTAKLFTGRTTVEQGILKGMYHCTTDLLFGWFGLVCFANKNNNCQLSYS